MSRQIYVTFATGLMLIRIRRIAPPARWRNQHLLQEGKKDRWRWMAGYSASMDTRSG